MNESLVVVARVAISVAAARGDRFAFGVGRSITTHARTHARPSALWGAWGSHPGIGWIGDWIDAGVDRQATEGLTRVFPRLPTHPHTQRGAAAAGFTPGDEAVSPVQQQPKTQARMADTTAMATAAATNE